MCLKFHVYLLLVFRRILAMCLFVLFLLLHATSLYTSFHGLADDVMLQYSFHEEILSFLIVAVYLAFPFKYSDLRCSRRSKLFLVS